MKAHLKKIWLNLQASYWFVPTIMAVGAVLLAITTTEIDRRVPDGWFEEIPFLRSNQPDGAHALLATVAGSMITVTGITFSLTLLAVSHATSQFGPRLLTNFMKDRGNQVTLGTFIATYLYCLIVLRTVRSQQDAHSSNVVQGDLLSAFVPQISVFIALLLTIASVGVLIYFIHHIPESMRLSYVVANIGRELIEMIPELFPESIANDQPEHKVVDPRIQLPDHFAELAAQVTSQGDGYLQVVDDSGLMKFAVKHDLIIQLCTRPGQFISYGQTLLLIYPAEADNPKVHRELEYMFVRGSQRTSTQNAMFLVDQLIEVAGRALSTGVNDPTTARTCIDWLQSALIRLTHRDAPESCRFDQQGRLRVVAPTLTFADFCSNIFDQLRPYVAADPNAALHTLEMIRNVASQANKTEHHEILDHHAQELLHATEAAGLYESDLAALRQSYRQYPRISLHES